MTEIAKSPYILENITTEGIRENWNNYKEIIKELSLFELIQTYFFKKIFKDYHSHEYLINIIKDFMKMNFLEINNFENDTQTNKNNKNNNKNSDNNNNNNNNNIEVEKLNHSANYTSEFKNETLIIKLNESTPEKNVVHKNELLILKLDEDNSEKKDKKDDFEIDKKKYKFHNKNNILFYYNKDEIIVFFNLNKSLLSNTMTYLYDINTIFERCCFIYQYSFNQGKIKIIIRKPENWLWEFTSIKNTSNKNNREVIALIQEFMNEKKKIKSY
jgi:hypothetical protein